MRASSVKRRCAARVRVEAKLLELLGDGAWHPAAAVRAAVEAVVEGCSQNHLQRAKKALGVEARKAGLNAGWECRLPKSCGTVSVEAAAIEKVLPILPGSLADGCSDLGEERVEPKPVRPALRKCRCEPKPIPRLDSDGEVACHKCGHPIAGGQS